VARAFRSPDDQLHDIARHADGARLQAHQFRSSFIVRQWKFDGLIDPAGPRRERRLDLMDERMNAQFHICYSARTLGDVAR
jgi:hypothetical protein